MKIVSDKEYEDAYNNLDIQKIMNSVTKRYYKTIPQEDLQDIKLVTLWKCLQKFNPEKGCKFTTYLNHNLLFRCKDWIWTNSKQFSKNRLVKERLKREKEYFRTIEKDFIIKDDYLENNLIVHDILDSLDYDERCLIEDRFLLSKTHSEIGKELNITSWGANLRIKKILEKLKNRFSEV